MKERDVRRLPKQVSDTFLTETLPRIREEMLAEAVAAKDLKMYKSS